MPNANDRAVYDYLFGLVDTSNTGIMNGAAAVPFLSRSGLERPVLKQVWSTSRSPLRHSRIVQ